MTFSCNSCTKFCNAMESIILFTFSQDNGIAWFFALTRTQSARMSPLKTVLDGARIFDLTVTSIDVIGPQQLATEELAIHNIKHF